MIRFFCPLIARSLKGARSDSYSWPGALTLIGLALAPKPILCERVNILLTRTEEINEVQTAVFACLANAQERQVFFNALLG